MKTTKKVLAIAAMAGAVALRANAGADLSADGKTLTLSAASGETLTYSSALPATVQRIEKIGAGRYDLAPSSSSFTGTIDIQAGTLGVDETKISSTAKWCVADGASFFITKLGGGEWDWRPSGALEIGGMGVNNGGAYQLNTSTSARHYAFREGTKLLSDALVTGSKWGLGNIDMGGHDLYVKPTSSGIFYMTEKLLSNPGNIHVLAGSIQFDTSSSPNPYPDFSGGAKYIVLSNDTTMTVSSLPAARPVTFGLKIPSGKATLNAGSSTSTSLTRNDSVITGPIDVAGALTVETRNHVKEGKTYRRAINLFGSVSVVGAFLHDATGILTFHDGQPHVFNGSFTTQWGGTTTFTNTTSNTFGSTVTLGGGRTEFVQSGPNARTEFRGKVTVTANNSVSTGATLAFEDAGDVVALAAENVVGGTTNAAAPCLSVSGATVFSVPDQASFVGTAPTNRLVVGKTFGTHGILAIGPDAVMTNILVVGVNNESLSNSGSGAIHMTGGQLYAGFGNDGESSLGIRYGFIGITNGIFEVKGPMWLGNWSGRGLLVQKGGTVRFVDSSLKLGRSGAEDIGSIYVAGGTFDIESSDIQMLNVSSVANGTRGLVTVDGNGAILKAREIIAAVQSGGDGAAEFINLNNGGVIETRRIRRSQANTTDLSDFYLNFDGGVLRAGATTNFLRGASYMPTRVTVFGGGAVIDTQTNDVTWLAPLVRPEGGGIASIDLPAGITNGVHSIGPGPVRIASTSGGTGASAVMDYDMETRQPTRIIVTSPGCGYEAGTTTVTVEDSSRNTYSAAFTVAANATTGGLTKRGSGTLTLSGANTYGGATRVEGGTVVFSNASGYPGGDFEVPAAAVRAPLAVPLLQAQSLSFSAGHGVRLTEADTLDHNNFGPSRTIATFEAPLAGVPSLTLVDSDGTVRADAGVWQLSLANGGRSLKLGAIHALTIVFK